VALALLIYGCVSPAQRLGHELLRYDYEYRTKKKTEYRVDKGDIRISYSRDGKSATLEIPIQERVIRNKQKRKVSVWKDHGGKKYRKGTIFKRVQVDPRRNQWKYEDDASMNAGWRSTGTTKGRWKKSDSARISVASSPSFLKVYDRAGSGGKSRIKLSITERYKFFPTISENIDRVGIMHETVPSVIRSTTKRGIVSLKVRREKFDVHFRYVDLTDVAREIAENIHQEKIHSIEIVPVNIDSRVAFGGSKIQISGEPPSAEAILRPYFKNKFLLGKAVGHFPDYVNSTDADYGTGSFHVYPGSYSVTIKNKNYYFVEKDLLISSDGKIEILMSELGTKHRVRIVEE
jgi:hypothetical protein